MAPEVLILSETWDYLNQNINIFTFDKNKFPETSNVFPFCKTT
jgi:hypothetical protein